MKKVLFLMMVYDNPIIMDEYRTLLKHYLFMKEKYHLDNFEFYGYTSGEKDGYDEELRLFSFNIGMDESYYATYIKTQRMFEYADKNLKFDYIYRTNTSTFCNVVLLNNFIQDAEIDDLTVCGGELYCKNSFSPEKNTSFNIYYPYIRGNSLILPKALLNPIYTFNNNVITEIMRNSEIILTADDDIIGYVLASSVKDVKCQAYFQEWLSCMPIHGHIFGNTNDKLTYLSNFIAIQIKDYMNREREIKTLKDVCEKFERYKYKKQHLENILEYYNGRKVLFIHPAIGYLGINDDKQYVALGMKKETIINFIKRII